jgi:hypothetical protein
MKALWYYNSKKGILLKSWAPGMGWATIEENVLHVFL